MISTDKFPKRRPRFRLLDRQTWDSSIRPVSRSGAMRSIEKHTIRR